MINIDLFANRSFLTLRLAFWRVMAYLAEHAIQHKPKIQKIIPILPLMGYGTLSYLFGWMIGEFLKKVIG
jgi:hypothetical protein